MGLPVIIYGKSGSGKSRSLKFFAPDEILYINVESKALPFRQQFRFVAKTDNVTQIQGQLAKMSDAKVRTAVIDDAGYIMTHLFMRNHRFMKGGAQFDMYNEIADSMYNLVKFVKEELPDDNIVYIVMHEDTSDMGMTVLKTLGKLLDQKVCLEGMVTIVIRCMSKDGEHFFRTVTDGNDITKAPEELFEDEQIDNNLKFVDDKIREFYGIKNNKGDK
ncbi:AAA family ATPase [Schwartzia succinivorans]|jgi:hypothetical protein|uniref:AAA domain-containing protein n=1 Tax=Schwartzia succinivorans DSM 10502 TaxID=1123243 RepID=A0A1M4V1T4_9FIRM|nr:AAA family ATPase [Schwartzia succinivorans]SHE62848.1 AAA domain-containing protein [Schwartzia succinivorans DSM 10502]